METHEILHPAKVGYTEELKDLNGKRLLSDKELEAYNRRWIEIVIDKSTGQVEFLNAIFASGKHIMIGDKDDWKIVWDSNVIAVGNNDDKHFIVIGVDRDDSHPSWFESVEDGDDLSFEVNLDGDDFLLAITLLREENRIFLYQIVYSGGAVRETLPSTDSDADMCLDAAVDILEQREGTNIFHICNFTL
jgi:3-dehydroquinate synthase class II